MINMKIDRTVLYNKLYFYEPERDKANSVYGKISVGLELGLLASSSRYNVVSCRLREDYIIIEFIGNKKYLLDDLQKVTGVPKRLFVHREVEEHKFTMNLIDFIKHAKKLGVSNERKIQK